MTGRWAIRRLTKVAPLEYGPNGVRVNSLHLGGTATAQGAARNVDYRFVPLQRIGEPAEVAAASLFLRLDKASDICGAELARDGGWTTDHYYTMLPGAPAGAI